MTNPDLQTFVTTMRALGIKRLAIDLTDAAPQAEVRAVEAAPPVSPHQRAVDIHEQQLLDERDAKRRLARAQAESDNILFSASCGWNPPALFIEEDNAAA